ncbi:general odorant-binding protein 71 isoform X2 [Nasonia vitripennis]|uniref:General odorant-binding protein 71 n=1 Tax=Nasonia vitripennis TaxID=7425 RepID=A0A7M7J4Q3_NASVI|nr:general odorant-binding protein 71 isoform X2 [Nasonia vitripennis]
MKKFTLIFVSCYLVFSSMHRVMSLKCRTGNQQSDDQFQKIMQICRRRFLGYDRENSRDFNARDTDSQESSDSDSDEDMFDNKFLTSAGSRYNNGKNGDKMGSGSSSRYDYSRNNSTRQSSSGRNSSNRSSNGNRSYYDNGQINSNRRSMRNSGMNSRGGYGDNNYSNTRYNSNNNNNNNNNNMNRNNMNGNNDGNYNNDGNNEREQACVTQCFFNELNLVDQRGFPERSAVIGIMTQNIQDPELRDFVEESVIECYHYINNNNSGRQEKCQFSQSLLSCLAEKGSETFQFLEMRGLG